MASMLLRLSRRIGAWAYRERALQVISTDPAIEVLLEPPSP